MMEEYDSIELKLIKLIPELDIVVATLSAERGFAVDSLDVQNAVIEVMELKDNIELIEKCPDSTTMLRLLEGFEFRRSTSEEIEQIEVEEIVIPEGIELLLEEEWVRANGKKWVIHKDDVDPFPSNPHAHNYQQNMKLDLTNGALYREKRYLGKMKKKHLIHLRSKIKHPDIPPLTL